MSKSSTRVLVADDQPDVLEALRLLLKVEGYDLNFASSPREILESISKASFDVLLIDLNYTRDTTSGQEGLDLLHQIEKIDSTLPVIVMTAWGNVELAVEAMRRGARDFVQKPWDNNRLLSILRTQVELSHALRREQRLLAENRLLRVQESPALIAESPAMRQTLELVKRVGPSDANVLLTGENGTGKTMLAKILHEASNRSDKAFVVVNAGGFSEGVFESELFGHLKGAFTDAKSDRIGRFEMADKGTLFLDEIANISLSMQAKLLRVVEYGEFERVGSSKTMRIDVRLISASNANLREEVASGRFRQDLLFRLNTVEIRLPALRERKEDIAKLAVFFLRQHTRHYRKPILSIQGSALVRLMNHPWPGNVRELDHVIERAVLLCAGEEIRVEDLDLFPNHTSGINVEEMSLEEVERLFIQKALARFDGNVNRAATALGLSRSALYRRVQRYGL